jgi:hypothetical protein
VVIAMFDHDDEHDEFEPEGPVREAALAALRKVVAELRVPRSDPELVAAFRPLTPPPARVPRSAPVEVEVAATRADAHAGGSMAAGSAAWAARVRRLVDAKVRRAVDAVVLGTGQTFGTERHATQLRFHEAERRLAEAEHQIRELQFRIAALEGGPKCHASVGAGRDRRRPLAGERHLRPRSRPAGCHQRHRRARRAARGHHGPRAASADSRRRARMSAGKTVALVLAAVVAAPALVAIGVAVGNWLMLL